MRRIKLRLPENERMLMAKLTPYGISMQFYPSLQHRNKNEMALKYDMKEIYHANWGTGQAHIFGFNTKGPVTNRVKL